MLVENEWDILENLLVAEVVNELTTDTSDIHEGHEEIVPSENECCGNFDNPVMMETRMHVNASFVFAHLV
jgi:hypothetical protein